MILLAMSLYVLIRAHVFSAEPLRTAPPRHNILSALAIAMIFLIYLFAGSATASLGHFLPATQRSSLVEIIAGISAIIATCAFSTRWFETGISGLGAAARNIPRGMVLGVLSFIAIIPILFIVLDTTDIVAKKITHKLPPVHPALKAMANDHSHISVALLVLIVVVIAPISEELFFRGLIQSWIGQKLARATAKSTHTSDSCAGTDSSDWVPPHLADKPAVNEFKHAVDENTSVIPVDPGLGPPLSTAVPPPRCWPQAPWLPRNRWFAILITAAIFAGVHYLVTPGYDEWFPSLFLLGVALGYIYERTGNIWTDITMHACFNLIPTLLVLSGVKPK